MPDLPLTPEALSDAMALVPPEDARAYKQRQESGVPEAKLGDPSDQFFKSLYRKSDTTEKVDFLLRESQTPAFKTWLTKQPNAALIAHDLDAMIDIRRSAEDMRAPPTVTWTEMFATGLRSSANNLGGGLVAVPALAASIPHALGMVDGESPISKVLDMSLQNYDSINDEQADQAARHAALGGGRLKLIAGSLLGQAPEMLATGFGTTAAVRSLFALAVGKTALSAGQLKAALYTSSAIQAGQEGAQNTVQRMSQNLEEGAPIISGADVAAGLAIAAVTMLTEIPMGARGEFRQLAGAGPAIGGRIGNAASELGVQLAQGGIQGGLQQIINDLASGKHINWSEAGWGAVAEMLGEGLFAAPGMVGAFMAESPNPEVTKQILQTATTAAKAGTAVKFADDVSAMVGKIAAAPGLSAMSEATLRQAVQADNGSVHISSADFSAMAKTRGVDPADLMRSMSATAAGGVVDIPVANFVANVVKNDPKAMDDWKAVIRSAPDSPSLNEISETIDTMDKLRQQSMDPMMPDGVTKDDSDDIVTEMTAEITTAAAVSGAKLTPGEVSTAAKLEAYRSRAAAAAWNEAYAAQGKTERVTPKQVWQKQRAAIQGEATAAGSLEQSAYHGTGNTTPYDRFSYDKVGGPGGEGAQAYGWGLYFTSLKEVAQIYREKFAGSPEKVIKIDGSTIDIWPGNTLHFDNGDSPAFTKAQKAAVTEAIGHSGGFLAGLKDRLAFLESAKMSGSEEVKDLISRVSEETKQGGKTYTVDIPEDSDMLDWDTPISVQGPAVTAAISELPVWAVVYPHEAGRVRLIPGSSEQDAKQKWEKSDVGKRMTRNGRDDYWSKLTNRRAELADLGGPDVSGASLYRRISSIMGSDRNASDALRKAGVPGIRYLGEKGKAGKDITNYVIFDDSKIAIQTLEQKGEGPARGTYDFNKRIVALGKNANASTIHHELMHNWLEVMRNWAADPAAPEVFRENMADLTTWATKNAGKIASTYEKVSGKKVDAAAIEAAAADFANLNLNTAAGRAIHEGLAYAYEQYLTKGEAPTKELRSLFKQISRYFNKIIKYLMRADIIVDENTRRVFDRMFVTSDMKEIGHLSETAREAAGMTPEMAGLLGELYGEDLAKAEQEAYKKLAKTAVADEVAKVTELAGERKKVMETLPVFRAQALLATKKLDAEAVKNLLAGTDSANLDLSEWTVAGGVNPSEISDAAGYANGPAEMLAELATEKTLDEAAFDSAEAILRLNEGPTLAERIDELANTDNGALVIALAELRALSKVGKATEQAAKEGAKAGKEKAEAKASATVAEVKAKMKQIADKAKMDKADANAAIQQFSDWMRADASVHTNLVGTKRLLADTYTFPEVEGMIAKAAAKSAKAAAKGHYAEALEAHLEVEILTGMARQIRDQEGARSAVDLAAVKADMKATVANLQGDTRTAKRMALEALKKGAIRDAAALDVWAKEQIRRMPMSKLNPSEWHRRVNAARNRRELAAAKQNVPGIASATEEIAFAIAMEKEILRTMAVREQMLNDLKTYTKSDHLKTLADAGFPSIQYPDGTVKVFLSDKEAADALMLAPHGSAPSRTNDLVMPARGISMLLSSDKATQQKGASILRDTMATNPGILTPEIMRMLLTQRIPVLDGPGFGPDLISNFTTDDFSVLTAQVVYLRDVAKDRPSVAKAQAELVAGGTEAVPSDTVPVERGDTHNFLFGTMRQMKTLIQPLGKWGQLNIQQVADDSNLAQIEMQRQVTKIMKPAQRALKGAKVDFKAPIVIQGMQTNRLESLVRLMMLGTATGRQRVEADLRTRNPEVKIGEFISTISQGLTKQEVDWLNASWKVNEAIWQWDMAAAKKHGVPLPASLEATPVLVSVDGKIVELTGGYAAVPYQGGEGPTFDIMDGSVVSTIDVAKGVFSDRVAKVDGKMLDLSSEAQIRSQMSHIRTAAYLGMAQNMRILLANDSDFNKKATSKLGKDWVIALKRQLQHTVSGVKVVTGYEVGARALHAAQTFAVFGLNLTTAVKQIGGLVVSAGHPDVGVKALLQASGKILGEVLSTGRIGAPAGRINSIDAMMLHRADGQDLDWASIEELHGSQSWTGDWKKFATTPMRRMQQIVDVITYQAAFDKALDKMPLDMPNVTRVAEAKRIAREAVMDTQGTALRSRAAEINHTQFGVVSTFAGKWMINNANWLRRMYVESKQQGFKGGKAAFTKAVFAGIVASSTTMMVIGSLIQPEDDDDEQRDLGDFSTKIGVDMLTSPHYLGRYVAALINLGISDQPWQKSVELVPIGGMAVSGASMIVNQMKDSSDEDDIAKIISGLIGIGSLVPTGIPAVELRRAIDAYSTDWESPFEMFVASLFGRERTPMIK